MLKEIVEKVNESKLFYVIDFKSPLNSNEIKDLKSVGSFTLNGNQIETTDKKVYNKVLDKADEIGLEYDNSVETLK